MGCNGAKQVASEIHTGTWTACGGPEEEEGRGNYCMFPVTLPCILTHESLAILTWKDSCNVFVDFVDFVDQVTLPIYPTELPVV